MARPNLTTAPELFYIVELVNYKNQVVVRQEYPTYGSAMRGVQHFEKTFPEYSAVFRDKNFYK